MAESEEKDEESSAADESNSDDDDDDDDDEKDDPNPEYIAEVREAALKDHLKTSHVPQEQATPAIQDHQNVVPQ